SPKRGGRVIAAAHAELGDRWLYVDQDLPLLFTENETNNQRLFGTANATPYVKDGINEFVVNGRREAVNPAATGTKAAAHYEMQIGAGEAKILRLRLSDVPPDKLSDPFADFDKTFDARLREADEF